MAKDRMTIMGKAEWAKECLVTDRAAGGRMFDQLLKDHGQDGMVHFRFAEALEYWGESSKAKEHFKQAEELFFMLEWKRLASQGFERCELSQRLAKLPDGLGVLWREVLAMRRSPFFRARAVVTRAAAQGTVESLTKQFKLYIEDGLEINLTALRRSAKFHNSFIDDLKLLQEVGNPAAHGANVSEGEYQRAFEASERIVESLIAETYLAKQGSRTTGRAIES
jgi:hypothetical protein